MYYSTRADNKTVTSGKSFENPRDAIKNAEEMKAFTGLHYQVFEVRQIWTTQTLDEAMKLDEGRLLR